MNVGTIMFVPVAVNVASEPSAPRATNVSVTSFARGSLLSGLWELPTTRENGDQPELSVLVREFLGRPAARHRQPRQRGRVFGRDNPFASVVALAWPSQ